MAPDPFDDNLAKSFDRLDDFLGLGDGSRASPPTSWSPRFAVTIEYPDLEGAKEAADEIVRHRSTIIRAPVGAGKSTVLPRLLAAQSRTTVLMILPTQLLAVHLYEYAKVSNLVGQGCVESYLYEGEKWSVLPKGVIYIDPAGLTRMIALGGLDTLKDTILYIDDTHKYDAYAGLSRLFTAQLPVRHLVRTVATLSIIKWFSPYDSTDQIWETDFEDIDVANWDFSHPEDELSWLVNYPTLVFCTAKKEASILSSRLRSLGNAVYRLTYLSTKAQYHEAMAAVKGPGVCTLIADDSFKHGFSFGIDRVIDLEEGLSFYKVPASEQIVETAEHGQHADPESATQIEPQHQEPAVVANDAVSVPQAFDLSVPLPEALDQRLLACRYRVWDVEMDRVLIEAQARGVKKRNSGKAHQLIVDDPSSNRDVSMIEAMAFAEAVKRFLALVNADPFDGRAQRVARGIAVRVKAVCPFKLALTIGSGSEHLARVDHYQMILHELFGASGLHLPNNHLGKLSNIDKLCL